uniref:Uncharacterized protein n=1 Tax=Arundo donax TaxID=35708 RepID=A0A0A9TAK2_ARUDO
MLVPWKTESTCRLE